MTNRITDVRRRLGDQRPQRISQKKSFQHADEAFTYFTRIRARLFKTPAYRGKFVAIRDRQVVDVDADKLVLYERVFQHFPDHKFIVSQVLREIPTVSIDSME